MSVSLGFAGSGSDDCLDVFLKPRVFLLVKSTNMLSVQLEDFVSPFLPPGLRLVTVSAHCKQLCIAILKFDSSRGSESSNHGRPFPEGFGHFISGSHTGKSAH